MFIHNNNNKKRSHINKKAIDNISHVFYSVTGVQLLRLWVSSTDDDQVILMISLKNGDDFDILFT